MLMTYSYMPETQGLSLESIHEAFQHPPAYSMLQQLKGLSYRKNRSGRNPSEVEDDVELRSHGAVSMSTL
jgi:hypothetical protein